MPIRQSSLPRIKSPCVSVCTVNPATRHCDGCARSLREIAQWSRMSDDERATVMAELPARMERLSEAT